MSVALVIQHGNGMHPTKLPSAACPALPYISTLRKKRYHFQKKVIEHKMCILIFSTTMCETFLILRRTKGDIITNVYMPSSKVPVILVRF